MAIHHFCCQDLPGGPDRTRALLLGTVPRLSRTTCLSPKPSLACGGDQRVDIGGPMGRRESKGCDQLSGVTFIKWAAGLALKEGEL